jgi:thiol:disulfide interchange protein
VFLLTVAGTGRGWAAAAGPFGVEATLSTADAGPELRVAFTVPLDHYLYASSIAVKPQADVRLTTLTAAQPHNKLDPFTKQETAIFDADFVLTYRVAGLAEGAPLRLEVSLQGCSHTLCYPPKTVHFELRSADRGAASAMASPTAAREDSRSGASEDARAPAGAEPSATAPAGFVLAARTEGYQTPLVFLRFLDDALAGRASGSYADRLGRASGPLLVLLILVGGLLLNLTPCVLPLIPINLAIVGAGAQAGSRGRGFALGAVYGLGIALAYGALGLVVVLAKVPFGALNASPWFNVAIAVLFVALALAMFDVFLIDLTRFRTASLADARATAMPHDNGRVTATGRRGRGFVAVFFMGCVAALLAGACVAPVVIAVVVLAGQRIAAGHPLGAALPFVLGLGMALPWPFAGAGLSLLPRPGRWMTAVRNGFGVLILALAVYYGYLAWELFGSSARLSGEAARALEKAQSEAVAKEGWMTSLPDALERSKREGKPVIVDFWASWCKNCLAMDRTTFRDAEVRMRLEEFVKVKVQAEDPSAPAVKAVLDQYGVQGLPTYVVLRAERRDR